MPAASHHPREPIDPDLSPDDPSEPSIGRGALGGPRRTARRRQVDVLAVISLGGMVGAAARFEMSRAIHVAPAAFPWATFWTNVGGSFALGFGLVLLLERLPLSRYLRPFFATGVVGAFTTMSTFEVEAVTLVKDGHAGLGVLYGLASVLAGLVAALMGIRLARLAPTSQHPGGVR